VLQRGAALALGGAAFALSARRSVRAATKLSVALDWYPNVDHAGLYLAQARGYFNDEGLDVKLYTPADPSTVLQTVGAGKDDLGISYQPELLLARAQGVPVVSVAALVQHPLMGLMATKEQHITRPHDLVGKVVGYPGIPNQEAMLATMLETDGATLDDVKLVDVGYDLVPAAISGRVAAVMGAYWTVEPILAAREGYPTTFLHVEDWGVPDYYELILTTSEKTARDRADVVRAFLRATQRGFNDAAAEPEAALDALVAASSDLDREVAAAGLKLLIPAWTDGVPAFGVQTAQRWDDFANWMKERGLIPRTLDVAEAYTTHLLPGPTATPAATPAS
jgi:putative hydroxymethylpyrimidine transport system substrate-binding protein